MNFSSTTLCSWCNYRKLHPPSGRVRKSNIRWFPVPVIPRYSYSSPEVFSLSMPQPHQRQERRATCLPHRAAVSYDWAGGRAGVNRSCQTCSLVRVRACACVRGEETQEQARGGHGRSTARRRDIAVTGAPALRRALTAPPRLAIGHPRKDWAGPGRPG